MNLAKQALRLIPAPIPPAARAPLLAALPSRLAAYGAVLALAGRFNLETTSSRAKNSWTLAPPPLTDEEWLLIAELMAEGKLPLVHSPVGVQRGNLYRLLNRFSQRYNWAASDPGEGGDQAEGDRAGAGAAVAAAAPRAEPGEEGDAMSEATHAYIGLNAEGSVRAIVSDDAGEEPDTTRRIEEWKAMGRTIERLPVAEAWQRFRTGR